MGIRAFSRWTIRRAFAALEIAALAMLFVRPRLASTLFMLVAVPFLFWKTAVRIDEQLESRRTADRFDAAGVAAKHDLSPEQVAHLRVVADDPAGVYRTLFQLDDARASGAWIPPGATVTTASWPRSIEWLLVVGDHPIDGSDVERQDFGAFGLARRIAARPRAEDPR